VESELGKGSLFTIWLPVDGGGDRINDPDTGTGTYGDENTDR